MSIFRMEPGTTWKIYYEQLDENGNVIGQGVRLNEYITYANACRAARIYYGDPDKFRYEIAWRCPYKEYVREDPCCICGAIVKRPETHEGSIMKGKRIRISEFDRTLPLAERYGQRSGLPIGELCDDCYNAIMKTVNDLKKGNINDLQTKDGD